MDKKITRRIYSEIETFEAGETLNEIKLKCPKSFEKKTKAIITTIILFEDIE